VTESIAEGLSAVGLVAGFPLLLLGFMISLERLETWGLRDDILEDRPPEAHDTVRAAVDEHDTVKAAVEEIDQLSAGAAGAQEQGTESAAAVRPSR
jgi:hypothetical protein